ncbi:hypothetical protein FACS189473_0300 [Spirochaetia bacterium]|nr:hypothetical protein FACS189473_0300 [Spirochaetia bacterium]
MAIKMKKRGLAITASIIAGVLAGLAACQGSLGGLHIGTPTTGVDTGTTLGSSAGGGGTTPSPTPPASGPSIALSWDATAAPWTGGETAVPDQGAVTWEAYDPQGGGGGNAGTLYAAAKAVLTNAPTGFEFLQWSFASPGSPLNGSEGPINFGGEWGSGAPLPASSPEMSLMFDSSGPTTATIYVWNCDSTGANRGTASVSFTVDVTEKPSITLSWEWNGITTALQNGGTVQWPSGNPAGIVTGVTSTAKAVLTGVPAGYELLQWSFDSASVLDTAPQMTLAPAGVSALETVDITYTPSGPVTQDIYVWNCDSSGNPGTLTAHFIVEATP